MAEGLGANFFLASGTWKTKRGHMSLGLLHFPSPSARKALPLCLPGAETTNRRVLGGPPQWAGHCISRSHLAHGPCILLPEAALGWDQEAERSSPPSTFSSLPHAPVTAAQ